MGNKKQSYANAKRLEERKIKTCTWNKKCERYLKEIKTIRTKYAIDKEGYQYCF